MGIVIQDTHSFVAMPYCLVTLYKANSLLIILNASLHPVQHKQSMKYMRQSNQHSDCCEVERPDSSTSLDYALIYLTTLPPFVLTHFCEEKSIHKTVVEFNTHASILQIW